MTKQYYNVANDFQATKLQQEHSTTVTRVIEQLQKEMFSTILRSSKLEEILPKLLETEESQAKLSSFLLEQFNTSVMILIQNGQKQDYKRLKTMLSEILGFCHGSEKYLGFYQSFIKKDIIEKGLAGAHLYADIKPKYVVDAFSNPENLSKSVNPYLTAMIASHVIKDAANLTAKPAAISTLIETLLMNVLIFQEDLQLRSKMLSKVLQLISFCRNHLDMFAFCQDELKNICQNKFVKIFTSNTEYKDQSKDNKFFSTQQLFFLEIHLQLDMLREEANAKFT
jgi:hypothetical protein